MTEVKPALGLRNNEFPGDWDRWLWDQGGDNAERLERLRRNLRRALETELTERQRRMLDLYYDQGRSMAWIARELAVNRSTVSRTIARARKKLYQSLKYSL